MQKFTKTMFKELLDELPSTTEVAGSSDDEEDARPVRGCKKTIIAWTFSCHRTEMKQLLKTELPDKLSIIMTQCFELIDKYSEDISSIDYSNWKRDHQKLREAAIFMEDFTFWEKLLQSGTVRNQIFAPLVVICIVGCAAMVSNKFGHSVEKPKANSSIDSNMRRVHAQVLLDGIPATKVKIYHRSGMLIGDDLGRFVIDTNSAEKPDSLVLSFGDVNRRVCLPANLDSVRYDLSSVPSKLTELAKR
ncbi:hypothetical protein GCM10022246_17850 [Pedobacter ginsengiterrae]|uniref:Uncharacterized protein n=1 Tax=Pedobacter ginsengiterrae TaxID=871696 RepID=A0ABP7PGD7_9SPHI